LCPFCFQAEDGIRDRNVTGVQTCALPISNGLGFLSLVAATNVLAVQYVLLYQNHYVATILWVLGIIWWVILTYLIFSLLTIKEKKPNLAQGINGAWLLAIVATQSIEIGRASCRDREYILPYGKRGVTK